MSSVGIASNQSFPFHTSQWLVTVTSRPHKNKPHKEKHNIIGTKLQQQHALLLGTNSVFIRNGIL